jgi:hypothetical protein
MRQVEDLCPKSGKKHPKVEGNVLNMGLFTAKEEILPNNAMIGEDAGNGDIVWSIVTWEYATYLYVQGVLEDRGYRVVNGIYYRLFYLPAPPHTHANE